jgi:hypothetical protein
MGVKVNFINWGRFQYGVKLNKAGDHGLNNLI